jgi:hypothetical protein
MILGDSNLPRGNVATLDDLFRRAGVRHPDAVALADPPNRENVTGGKPRALSFAQADRAISAIAARLRGLGLQTDTVVTIQLPNTVESVVTFLGVIRAGMIAVPVPLLWRQQEMVAALSLIGAKAIITSSRIGAIAHADIAMQAAVKLFPIRHVCGFGRDLPDGMAPLDDVFTTGNADIAPIPPRLGPAGAHVAAITFERGENGVFPVARNHAELATGGQAVFLESGITNDAQLLSTIPICSFAGISVTILPWLLSGGTLHLHHGFDPDAFAEQCGAMPDAAVVVPAQALAALMAAGLLDGTNRTIVALWRSPERLATTKPWECATTLVDVASFGEIGLVASRRRADGKPTPLPRGVISAPRDAIGAMTVIEAARSSAGTLALRGPMVPTHAFPPGAERGQTPHLAPDNAGYVDTGFACRLDRDAQALAIAAPPVGTIAVGGYSFHQSEVDAMVAQVDPNATIVALPDRDLGQRLAGNAADRSAMRDELHARGVNPLISGAFQPRGGAEAA